MAATWELVKTAGSLVGLATGAFVLFDRLFGGRPYGAWLAMDSHTATLEVVNTSDRYVYLERIACWPTNARASRFATDGTATLADHWGIERTISLAPGKSQQVSVTWARDLPPKGWTLIVVRWRKAGALLSLPALKVARWRRLALFRERDPAI